MSKSLKRILAAFIALFVLIGTFVYLYHKNSVKSQEIAKYEQNWKAATDSVEHYKLLNGELLAERQTFILNEDDMKKQLDLSAAEIKDLKKKLGSALALVAKVDGQIQVDTLYMESEPTYIAQDTISAPFSFKDEWLTLNGDFNYGHGRIQTTLYNINMSTPLTIGESENGKFFVSSPNPYLYITDINAVISEKVIPKKKHWAIGLGIGPSVGYDFHHKDIYYGFGAQLGLQYNF